MFDNKPESIEQDGACIFSGIIGGEVLIKLENVGECSIHAPPNDNDPPEDLFTPQPELLVRLSKIGKPFMTRVWWGGGGLRRGGGGRRG